MSLPNLVHILFTRQRRVFVVVLLAVIGGAIAFLLIQLRVRKFGCNCSLFGFERLDLRRQRFQFARFLE